MKNSRQGGAALLAQRSVIRLTDSSRVKTPFICSGSSSLQLLQDCVSRDFLSGCCYTAIMVFRWREDHTPIVLDLFRSHECLWNNKKDGYKSKSARDIALQNIVEQLNIPEVTVEDIKAKIKTIRTRYSSELSKVVKSKNSGSSNRVYVPKLFWYKQADSFLRSVCVPRTCKPQTRVQPRRSYKPETPRTTTQFLDEDDEASESYQEEMDDGMYDVDSDDSANDATNSMNGYESEVRYESSRRVQDMLQWSQQPMLSNKPRPTVLSVKPNRDERQDHELEASIKKRKWNSLMGNVYEEEDEYETFSRHIANQLRQLPLEVALRCQNQMHSLVINERIKCVSSEKQSSMNNMRSSEIHDEDPTTSQEQEVHESNTSYAFKSLND